MASILLVVHPERPAAWELAKTAKKWWQDHGREVIDVRQAGPGVPFAGADKLEFAVSLGGDGTMLRTVELVLAAGVPVLGVNLGRMGYLTAVEPSGIEQAFDKMLAGEYLVEERMALDVELTGSAPGRFTALNDAIVERTGPGHTIRVAVEIAGRPFLTYLPAFFLAHLTDPKHAMPLQAGVRQIDGTLIQRPVDVAAADQDEIHEVAGEFQQQPVGGMVLPGSEPGIRKPDTVAIAEAQLHRGGVVLKSPQIAKRPARSLGCVGLRLLIRRRRSVPGLGRMGLLLQSFLMFGLGVSVNVIEHGPFLFLYPVYFAARLCEVLPLPQEGSITGKRQLLHQPTPQLRLLLFVPI